MTARRAWMFVLATASAEGLILALSSGAMHVTQDSNLLTFGPLILGIVVVTSLLWLGAKPAPAPLYIVGAFVLPVVVAIVLAPIAAFLVILGYLPNVSTWVAAMCALGGLAAAAALRRQMPGWRLAVLAVLALSGIVVITIAHSLSPVLFIDPLSAFSMRFSLAGAAGLGLVCAATIGVWAAAMGPAATAIGQAEQALPADGGSGTLTSR